MKTLTWHYGGLVHTGSHDVKSRRGGAAAYRLPADYYPTEIRLTAEGASRNGPVQVDVQADGVSIFDNYPQLDEGAVEKVHRTFKVLGREKLAKQAIMTLEVIDSGSSAVALTVELDLEEAKDM